MPAQQMSVKLEYGIEQGNNGVDIADRSLDSYVTRDILEVMISRGLCVAES